MQGKRIMMIMIMMMMMMINRLRITARSFYTGSVS